MKKLERTEQNYLKFEETEGTICANIVYIPSVLGNGIKDLWFLQILCCQSKSMCVIFPASARELLLISPVSLSSNVRGLWRRSNGSSCEWVVDDKKNECEETCSRVKYSTNKIHKEKH